jgi:tripartite-type tricarboxylate transporter receptor subunit TctC
MDIWYQRKEEVMMCKIKDAFLVSLLSVSLLICIGWSDPAQSQDKYPVRAVDIIVPFSAGGSTDLTARLTGGYAEKKWGVRVNVINKPGGNGVPACVEVHNAAPNGYTLQSECFPTSSMLPITVKKLPFKIMDRSFIATAIQVPIVLVVPSKSRFKGLNDLVDWAKKNPEKLKWGSGGGTMPMDIAQKQLFMETGIDISKTKPVMVKGGADAFVLAGGNHVMLTGGAISTGLPTIKAGVVKPLFVTSDTRLPFLPDVPTSAELGYPMITIKHWVGLSGPANLPSYVVDKWDEVIQEMLKDPEILSKLKNVAIVPFYHNAIEMREMIPKETETIRKVMSLK